MDSQLRLDSCVRPNSSPVASVCQWIGAPQGPCLAEDCVTRQIAVPGAPCHDLWSSFPPIQGAGKRVLISTIFRARQSGWSHAWFLLMLAGTSLKCSPGGAAAQPLPERRWKCWVKFLTTPSIWTCHPVQCASTWWSPGPVKSFLKPKTSSSSHLIFV
jgi:hypothetical protein